MKLVIFGATGTIGRQVVEQALEQGHTVSAFSRHVSKPMGNQNVHFSSRHGFVGMGMNQAGAQKGIIY